MSSNPILRPDQRIDNEEVDVKQKSLFARLKKLFSSGVVVRNVGGKKLKVKDTSDLMYATDRNSLRDRFNRVRSTSYNAYTRDFSLAYQAARIDLFRDYDCVAPDTIIPLPDGTYPTIKELAEKYKDRPQERFYVFSYDHKTDSIKLGKAYHPRKKGGGERMGYKVTFDNGQYVIGSIKHPFLMRNGEYKMIFDLKVGESVMPSDINNNRIPKTITESRTIVSIECIGPLEVYDVTVEEYHNFATDSCVVANTMDMDPIIASALDIYADESLTHNEMGKVLVVNADDDNIKGILTNLFYDVLNIEHNLWSWVRNTCKYGDFFMRLYISPEYGVYQIEPISAYNVERLENTDPLNKNYVKFQIRPTDTSQVENLEFFECAHFRLLSDSNFLPYGKSMIEGGRRVWKQLSLLEDAMLISRIMRAPERRIFKIDVGNIPPQEIDAYMEKLITKMKKVPYVDPTTGDYNLRFNLQNMVEDFYLPVRGSDSGNSIDTLSGIEFTGIDDIEYIRNKMMAALKIPKAFLGYEEELSGKATLASEDVRFARTIQRVQKIIVSELEKIAIVHLYSQGYRDESLVNFKIELTNPSTIFEKEKIEVWGNKVDVASRMMEIKLFPKSWVYENVFNLSKDDVSGLQDQIVEDSKQLFRYRSIEEEGNDPAQPFKKINPNPGQGPGGGLGGGPPLGGGLGSGMDLTGGAPIGGGGLGGPPPLEEDIEESGSLVTETPAKLNLPLSSNLTKKQGEHSEEYKRNRDQTGEKDATQYPRGEDYDGHLEMRGAMDTSNERSTRHKFAGGSPLSLDEKKRKVETINKGLARLGAYLEQKGSEKKELIKENGENKSLLDESQIIDE